ncbi:hypothetical protein ACLK11_08245 [Escherichia coli]
MRYRNSRQVTGVVKNVTVSQSCGKWYISIQTESEVSTPAHLQHQWWAGCWRG